MRDKRFNNVQMLKDNLSRIEYHRAFVEDTWARNQMFKVMDETSIQFTTVSGPEDLDFGADLYGRNFN